MKVNDRLPGFAEGTKVLMADGSLKNIETVKSGDYVLSFAENNAFAPLEKKKVLDIFKRVDRNILEIKAKDSSITIKCAPGQLFIGPGDDWKTAPDRADLIDTEGNIHNIEVSRITRGKHMIYDIVVEQNHSLVANGVRVHNMLYTVADVVAGRQLASIDPGPVSNYYRRDDLENSNIFYNNGNNKKKKARRKKDYRPEPKISGTVAAAKILSSVSDLVDSLSEIVEETTPANLARLRLAVQSSSENIVLYLQGYVSAVFTSEVSAFDKSELSIMGSDMITAASALRNPFVKPTLTAADKLEAMNQLTLLELLVTRSEAKYSLYLSPTDENRDLFDVELDGKKVNRSKTKQNKNTRASNGQFREGGSRSDFGSDRGRGGNLGKGPGQTKSTSPAGPGTSTRDKGKTGYSGYGGASKDNYGTSAALSATRNNQRAAETQRYNQNNTFGKPENPSSGSSSFKTTGPKAGSGGTEPTGKSQRTSTSTGAKSPTKGPNR